MGKIVPDTSVIIECLLSSLASEKYEVIIHEAVLAELQHQANQGKATGFIGLEELENIRKIYPNVRYAGRRPLPSEIRNASLGEIDALIMDLAYSEDATLYTADKVLMMAAKAKGVKVELVKPKTIKTKMKLEDFFDETTMSVHLKENVIPIAKKGVPGNWKFVRLSNKKLEQELLKDISREIIEETKRRKDAFVEIEREGSTIVQLERFRIVITRPPFSDGWEITAVRPVKKLSLEDYKLSEKLYKRVSEQAEGILVAGSPGMGKSTFAQAMAEFYATKDKIVKTIEAPRDMVLGDEITQYAISHADSQEIHDILLLSRPDYTIFDEMRNTEDFKLFADLRLSGIGLMGVLHATNPIDAIQRFIGRAELGVIPQIIDTVVFIKNGTTAKVLALEMTVKVPAGMTEADLARPIVVVTDFETGKPEFEIYSYGEETVVVPTGKEYKVPAHSLAEKQIENELLNHVKKVKVRVSSGNRAEVYVPKEDIAYIIGKEGKNIEKIEKKLGIGIDVRELEEKKDLDNKESLRYDIDETGRFIAFRTKDKYSGSNVDLYADGHFLLSSTLGKKGDLKIDKKSKIGQILLRTLDANKEVELRV